MGKKTLVSVLSLFILLTVSLVWFTSHTDETDVRSSLSKEAAELRALRTKWKDSISKDGPQKAYAAFLAEAPTLAFSTHSQAHAFGEALYDSEGLEGLKVCDSSFQFGCYHSFLSVAVNEEGIGALPQFNEACKNGNSGSEGLPCQHGIGHGLLVYTDYDLLKALELCETISTLPTGGCSSGVFMEYNFHTMQEINGGTYIRELGEDPYEPCSTLPERFRASCYFEQVQWWQNVYGSDFKHIGSLCAALPVGTALYDACYNGIGNYTAASEEFAFEGIVASCALMPNEETKGLCHEGATWLIQGEKDLYDAAVNLCEVLEEPYRLKCLQKLN